MTRRCKRDDDGERLLDGGRVAALVCIIAGLLAISSTVSEALTPVVGGICLFGVAGFFWTGEIFRKEGD